MKGENLKRKLNAAKVAVMASIPEAILFCNALVTYAKEESASSGNAVVTKVQNSSTSIYGVMKLISMSLLVVVLGFCGIVMMIGTQKMKDGIKEHFYHIAIGVAILFTAKEIADYLEDTFG